MDIKLTNTLGRKKELFKPIKKGKVGIYTCGPTVYNYAHIGNLRAYVFADTLKRMFLFNSYNVKHVMNITDVGHLSDDADDGEDKMEKGAAREGKTVWEVAQHYTDAFLKDLDDLNIIRPDELPKATEHIADMIGIIKKLEDKGYAYISGGNVYFDALKFKDYGKLAKLNLDEEHRKSRVGDDENKKSYFDFALWFTNYKWKNHAMLWDSPWGKGFPGWHIECSAMSSKYLGENFDIHTGGIDHIPVHHTNEIAQSEAAFGHKWVNYWLHNDWLIINNEKVAKSAGNFLRLKTLIDEGYAPEDYRYYLLGAHYRSPLNFTFESLDGAKNAMTRLKGKMQSLLRAKDGVDKKAFEDYVEKFRKEINDDLNTPKALAVLWEVMNSEKMSSETKHALVLEFNKVLGLGLDKVKKERLEELPHEIIKLKDERDQARKAKEWKKSDEIRNLLVKKGYEVLDTPQGSVVKKK